MRIGFVGGTRFIGRAAVERALAAGHTVTVMHRGEHPCDVPGARVVRVDRSDGAALARAIAEAAPEVVVDTRAMTAAQADTVANAARAVPVVVLSSHDVYAQFGRINGLPGGEPEARIVESSPKTVAFPFRGIAAHEGGDDYDKKDVERVYAAAHGRATVLRLPAVYGRRDPKRRFGVFVDAIDACEGRECVMPCQNGAAWRWTHADVDDVAHAIVLAAEARLPTGAVFNVCEAETPTMRERVERIADAMGARVRFEERDAVDDRYAWLGAQANDVVVDSTAIRDALGYRELTSEAQRVAGLVAALRASRAG